MGAYVHQRPVDLLHPAAEPAGELPSGAAGGLVTKDRRYSARYLLFTPTPYGAGGSVGQENISASVGARLENGTLLDPDASPLYKFQDYALAEMVVNSIGQFPIEMFYTSGLRKLVAHDAESPTSYIKTLKCFLDHNMNVTHTAKALYLHRSTLIERMERIRELLGDDLSDPDVRLRLALVFKAIELHDDMQDRFEERSGSTWL